VLEHGALLGLRSRRKSSKPMHSSIHEIWDLSTNLYSLNTLAPLLLFSYYVSIKISVDLHTVLAPTA
jgi:hypothetical protein